MAAGLDEQRSIFYQHGNGLHARDGELLGEFPENGFRRQRASGGILATDHYWTEGMTDWKMVSDWRAPIAPTKKVKIAPARPGGSRQAG
ncbi:MAG: DUF4339 domain-containing protein [Verrucomicrobiota bacterium]|nr:DUF4339 domain-containing protein [Verrucomicrobiota bacterium]